MRRAFTQALQKCGEKERVEAIVSAPVLRSLEERRRCDIYVTTSNA